jgi:hypothetical protein
MRGHGLDLLLGGALAILQPALAPPAHLAIGTAATAGRIQVDGAAVPSGVVVFSGDRIATSSAGASVYLRKAAEVVLGPATTAQVMATGAAYSVQLDLGELAARDGRDAPILVKAGGVTVESKTTNGSFEVAFADGHLRVLARRGVAVVTGANRTVEAPAGNLMSAAIIPIVGAVLASKILLVTVIAATAATGTILGVVSSSSNPTCVSASQLNCP